MITKTNKPERNAAVAKLEADLSYWFPSNGKPLDNVVISRRHAEGGCASFINCGWICHLTSTRI
jgi:hypothetical protein